MEEFISELMKKVGLDRSTAEKVFGFVKDNATKIPQWIASGPVKGIAEKVGLGGLVDKLGGK